MQSGQSAGSGESMAAKRARFEQLAMPAVNALYRQAMRLTNNPDDAQDLVQDTFERGFKAFDSFQPGSNFEAWMTTIERNAYFNQYAKAKRRPQRANDSTGEYDDWDIYDAAEHTSDGLKSAEEEYLDAFAPEEIMAALAKLSPERRQVFIDVLIHLAGTETNLKTNAFMRLVALSCLKNNVPVGEEYIADIEKYEANVTSKRC